MRGSAPIITNTAAAGDLFALANPAAQNVCCEDQEEEGRRARGLGPLERYRGPGSVSCDPDASGLTMVYLTGKLLP